MARKTHVEVRLTGREADELYGLLFSVLTNGDQWETYDLAALQRVTNKLKTGLIEAID